MASHSDHRVLSAYVANGGDAAEAARAAGCTVERVYKLVRSPSAFVRTAHGMMDVDFEHRKHIAIAELATLEIVR